MAKAGGLYERLRESGENLFASLIYVHSGFTEGAGPSGVRVICTSGRKKPTVPSCVGQAHRASRLWCQAGKNHPALIMLRGDVAGGK